MPTPGVVSIALTFSVRQCGSGGKRVMVGVGSTAQRARGAGRGRPDDLLLSQKQLISTTAHNHAP
eukprot:1160786-Pelagomonas_calceolata.AAC.2